MRKIVLLVGWLLVAWGSIALAQSIVNPGGGGSGGAVTIADGADVALGTTTDAAWSSGSGTLVSILKNIAGSVANSIPAGTNVIGHVIVDTAPTTAVTGTFYQATQPVSLAAISHASTTALGTSLVAKASAGNLAGYNCTGIAGAAAGYCIAYNGTTAPSTGALTGANVLDFCYFDTTARGCSLSRIPLAAAYSTGIVILISSATTPYTYTTGTDTGAITVDYQ